MNIADNAIEQAVSYNSKSSIFVRDRILAGSGVRTYPSGKASHIIEPTVNRSTKRKVIGKSPALFESEARERAKDEIQKLATVKSSTATSATFPVLAVAYEGYITQIIRAYLLLLKHTTSHLTWTVKTLLSFFLSTVQPVNSIVRLKETT